MPTRKPRNPELAQAVTSLNEAAQHVRNAVHGKIDDVRGAAQAELAKVKAKALTKTTLTHDKVEAVLKKAEARWHKAIATAQTALDKAVRAAEKRSAAATPAPVKKAVARRAPAKKAAAGGKTAK